MDFVGSEATFAGTLRKEWFGSVKGANGTERFVHFVYFCIGLDWIILFNFLLSVRHCHFVLYTACIIAGIVMLCSVFSSTVRFIMLLHF